jgi:multiple sugar transport system substrate-binding protein
MNKKIIIGIVVIVLIAIGYIVFINMGKKELTKNITNNITSLEKVKLTYAIHWSEKVQTEGIYENGVLKSKGLNQYLNEYTVLHPNVEFDVKIIPYADYASTLKVLSDADMAPDIYQIYSNWGVSYVKDGILDKPSDDIVNDVKNNYISTAGVTIDNQIWGIPTEINDYVLLYNKDIFKKAGLVDTTGNVIYPKKWQELIDTAVKLTKRDSKGHISQYGIAFSNEDWQVVDPFLSILFSNGGKYLSDDMKKSLFNSKEGVEALEAELALFKKGATDTNGNFFDFGKGKVAMVIAPPWVKSGFKENFGDKFESTIGVAPIPVYKNPATSGYSWFTGVMAKSKNKEEAWKFLKWFTLETQPETNTTRYGDLLTENIGSIPARKIDFESHKEVLGDFFTKEYVNQMQYAIAEPNIERSSEIKNILVKEILSAWAGQKTAKGALDSAASSIDKILATN